MNISYWDIIDNQIIIPGLSYTTSYEEEDTAIYGRNILEAIHHRGINATYRAIKKTAADVEDIKKFIKYCLQRRLSPR